MNNLDPRTTNIVVDILSKTTNKEFTKIIQMVVKKKIKKTLKFEYNVSPSTTTDWNVIRVELADVLGENGFHYFNDKRKKFRRIKLYGIKDTKQFLKFVTKRYPHLHIYHSNENDKSKSYRNFYDGYCFKLPL